ncbi:MAG: glycosyltransferase [Methylococcaceae bacterium]
MKKNSILIFLPTAILGGAERVAYNLANYLARDLNFAEVSIYFMSRGRQSELWSELDELENITLIYADCQRERNSLLPLLLFAFKTRFMYVYSTHTHVNAFLSLLSTLRLLRCKKLIARESTVISDRFTGLRAFEFKMLYKLYRSHDLLICQTQYMHKRLIETQGDHIAKKIKVIPNPVNLSIINKMSSQYEYKYDQSFINITCVGRLISVKNFSLVLQAIYELPNKHKSDVFIHLVGDGNLKNDLKDLAVKLGVRNIKFHGNIKNPFSYMNQSDIGIVSSLKEGFPNVLLEMMAAGTKYIISTPCAGDIDLLDEVFILKNFETKPLALEIEKALLERPDKTKVYQEYVLSRSTLSFWNVINQQLAH